MSQPALEPATSSFRSERSSKWATGAGKCVTVRMLLLAWGSLLFEPHREKISLMSYANNKESQTILQELVTYRISNCVSSFSHPVLPRHLCQWVWSRNVLEEKRRYALFQPSPSVTSTYQWSPFNFSILLLLGTNGWLNWQFSEYSAEVKKYNTKHHVILGRFSLPNAFIVRCLDDN